MISLVCLFVRNTFHCGIKNNTVGYKNSTFASVLCLLFHSLDISYTSRPYESHDVSVIQSHGPFFSRDVVLSQSGGGMIACAVSTHDAPG